MPRKVVRYSVGVDPYILLMGCRPWSRADEDGNKLKKRCPVCHKATQHDGERLVLCAKCSAASPLMSRLIVSREVGAPESGRRAQSERNEQRIMDDLSKRHPVLDETTRRLIWNGYRGVFTKEIEEPSNLARIGRMWLISIDQKPNWDAVDESATATPASA